MSASDRILPPRRPARRAYRARPIGGAILYGPRQPSHHGVGSNAHLHYCPQCGAKKTAGACQRGCTQ